MSGPWDRPPSPNADDGDWPTDETAGSSPDRAPDPWSPDDPWQERRDAAPAWDEWSPTVPAPEDAAYEEPAPPSSDPWAESWVEEEPGIPTAPEPAFHESAAGFSSPNDADIAPPDVVEPVEEADPVVPRADAVEPRTEPWSPDQDPWGPSSADAWIAPAPPSASTDEPAGPIAPVWLVEAPAVEPPPEPEAEPEPEPEFETLPAHEPASAPDAAPEPDAAELEAEPEPSLDAPLTPERDSPPEASPDPWAEPDRDPWSPPQAEPQPEFAPAAVAGASGWETDAGPSAEADSEPAAEPPSSVIETDDEDIWQPQPWRDPGASTQVFPTSWTPPPAPEREPPDELEPESGEIRTSLGQPDASADADELAAAPSTAEQAVPWLIGVILLLAGMVIVLLALIFAGDASLGGGAVAPSGSSLGLLPSGSGVPSERPRATPAQTARVSAAPTPTPVAAPQFGPLEMVYQGRSAALAPIYLLRHDFTSEDDPEVMAQDANLDVRRLAWAPDGSVGAGLLADVLVSIEPGKEKRRLGDSISTITFGEDAETVFAVRVTADGANDVATVLGINFASGDTQELASVTYPRPDIAEEAALTEAQFTDEGGTIRLFWMKDGNLRLWSLGGGTWTIDPADGAVTELDEALPLLWSPDGRHQVALTLTDGTTDLVLTNHAGDNLAATHVDGLVSHLRWSADGERVVFTVGRSATGGGVLQDLFLWDLADAVAPMQLTSTGAAFGAEWLGATPDWDVA